MDYGDKICHYILTDDTEHVIVRSMVRSATNTTRPNSGYFHTYTYSDLPTP